MLGKRYERLLFFTAPISLAVIMVCLVALASTQQKERVEARCYLDAVDVFSKKEGDLESEWNKANKKDVFWYLNYKLKVSKIWIYENEVHDCYGFIDQKIEEFHKLPPVEMLSELNSRANKLKQIPISMYGVSLPKDATIDLFVTKITVDFLTLTGVLQIVLLPVILLWLGSLYSTRYREGLTVAQASSLVQVFPHVINMYPAFDLPSVRKRNILAPFAKPIACLIYALIRVGLLLIFIFPPVFSYLYSLYISASEKFSVFYFVAGVVVFIFFLTTIFAEFLPFHYKKIFPDPLKNLRL